MIKVVSFFIFSLFAFSLQANAQKDSSSPATVYIIRATGEDGSAVNYRIIVSDQKYKIKNDRYEVLYFIPGKYTFYVTDWFHSQIRPDYGMDMQLEGGHTYYLHMVAKLKYASEPLYVEEITARSALPMIEKLKEEKTDQ